MVATPTDLLCDQLPLPIAEEEEEEHPVIRRAEGIMMWISN